MSKTLKNMRRRKKKAKKWDRHDLYQESVQNPPFEVEFLTKLYHSYRDKRPTVLREDFCGTAILCCEWARQIADGRAFGIDLDRPTLEWGRENNLSELNPEQRSRIDLLEKNVLDAVDVSADVVAAFNFSYFVFKTRRHLREYFDKVYESLPEDGIFVLDLYGGPEAQVAQEESTEQDPGFDYVWDQDFYNPITGEAICHIHFDLPDGSRMEKAFTYDWRLWSMPEVRDALEETGFKAVDVYWEGTDEDGDGDGEFTLSVEGDDASAWVAYIAAVK